MSSINLFDQINVLKIICNEKKVVCNCDIAGYWNSLGQALSAENQWKAPLFTSLFTPSQSPRSTPTTDVSTHQTQVRNSMFTIKPLNSNIVFEFERYMFTQQNDQNLFFVKYYFIFETLKCQRASEIQS